MAGIDRIVLCGLRANACVEGTARWAVELGYHVTLVGDATAAFRWEEWAATVETNAPSFAHAIVTTGEMKRVWSESFPLPNLRTDPANARSSASPRPS